MCSSMKRVLTCRGCFSIPQWPDCLKSSAQGSRRMSFPVPCAVRRKPSPLETFASMRVSYPEWLSWVPLRGVHIIYNRVMMERPEYSMLTTPMKFQSLLCGSAWPARQSMAKPETLGACKMPPYIIGELHIDVGWGFIPHLSLRESLSHDQTDLVDQRRR